ncbi:MAG: PQQ-binding-like beta-propeller repeat protein [Ilumatobacteraceae bacterium]
MSELPPPSFPPPSVEPVEPVELADPVPVTERPDARGWRNPTRATILVVLGSVLALVVAGFVFIVRNEPSDSDDGTVSFELRWDERAPALAGIDDVDPIRTLGAYDDVVVFSAADTDADAALVVGVDRGTGDQRWDVRLPEAIGGGAVGRIVDDQLFVVAGAGDPDDDTVVPGAMRLTVLDPRNGDELWSHDGLDAAPRGSSSVTRCSPPPVRSAAADGTLVALTGARTRAMGPPIAGSSMPVVVRSDGFVVVDGSGRDATYVGLDLDGEERWSIEAEASISGADWYPDAAGGVVALVDGDS